MTLPIDPTAPWLSQCPLDWSPDEWRKRTTQLTEYVVSASTGWEKRRPTPNAPASEIRNQFRSSLPDEGIGPDQAIALLQDLIPLSGFNGHPRWFGYITSSPDPIGVLGDFFASALNQNTNLWRIAPAATSIELQTLDWLKEIIGFPSQSEGVFCSGGQFANLIAHAVIRKHALLWNVREDGVAARPIGVGEPRFYVSNQAHYCHAQSLDLLGLGTRALRLVPVDSQHRMDLNALEKMITEDQQAGHHPIAVIATAGTVGVGAVDPVLKLRSFTNARSLWLHVDAAYGGPGALAPSANEDLRAISEADSIAFDPHKWLYSPIDAGVTLIRKPGLLPAAFGNQVSYLDQRSAQDGILDFVNYTPENSRPFRALKVWLALQAHGKNGLSQSIERDFQLAQLMAQTIGHTPELRLAAEVQTSIVCWTFEPQGLQLSQEQKNTLQLQILEEIEKRGIALLSKAQLPSGEIALRACFVNFRTCAQDVLATVQATRDIGAELATQL